MIEFKLGERNGVAFIDPKRVVALEETGVSYRSTRIHLSSGTTIVVPGSAYGNRKKLGIDQPIERRPSRPDLPVRSSWAGP